jgi:PAS domain S-box-containing protein
VQFYETDAHLTDVVSRFIGAGLIAGDSAIVIATQQHQAMFERALSALGIDPAAVRANGRLMQLDARNLLARIMVEGRPDAERFDDVVGGLFRTVKGRRVRAFCELIDLLWRDGDRLGALRLEELWNGLREQHSFSVRSAYVMASFYKEEAPGAPAAPRVPEARPDVRDEDRQREFAELERRIEIEAALRHALSQEKRTEEELLASQQQLRVITDALPALIAYVDDEQRYRFVNAAYETWFGRPRSEILGMHVRDLLGPAAFHRVRSQIDRALAGHTVQFQTWWPLGETSHYVDAAYVPRVADDGHVLGFTAFVTDITERRRLEDSRQIAALRATRLMRITAGLADAVAADDVYEAIVDRVAEALGATRIALWMLRDDDDDDDDDDAAADDDDDDAVDDAVAFVVRSVGYGVTLKGVSARFEAARVPAVDAIRAGEAVWIASRAGLRASYPDHVASDGSRQELQLACIPIVVAGRPRGALEVVFNDPSMLDGDGKNLLLLIGRYAGQALERLRLFEVERRKRVDADAVAVRMEFLDRASRRFLEIGSDLDLLLDGVAHDVTAVWGDGCAVFLTREPTTELELAALDHRSTEASDIVRALVTESPWQLVPVPSATVARTGVLVVANDIDVAAAVANARPAQRSRVERFAPRHVLSVPLRARGKIVGALQVLRDAHAAAFTDDDAAFFQGFADRCGIAIESARLRQENERGRLRAELLYGLARALIGADQISAVFDAALDAIELTLGTSRSAILAVDPDGIRRFKRWRGLSDEYRAAIEGPSPSPREVPLPDEIVVVPDIEADPRSGPYRPVFRNEGIRALVVIPLIAAGRLVGRLLVYYATPRSLGAEELEVASAIANHVAAAMSRFAALDELHQTVRFNEMFTGILGHDLRNPLNAIMTAAELVIARDESERVVKPVARILNSGRRMARMIDQLLDFTRMRLGEGIPLERTEVDLVALVREVMGELSDANPGLQLRFEQHGNVVGWWDCDRLAQVFSNLVANATQHGDPGHAVHVCVDGRDPDRVRVDVNNVGVIPETLLPRLFLPMTGGVRRRDKAQGLGLGLYISQEIVRGHEGVITVVSNEAEGTTFTVTLPRKPRIPEAHPRAVGRPT